jgi:CheY-like chemotaxis protein
VVEDDPMVRVVTQSMLEMLGYTVLVAGTPQAALSLSEQPDVRIDLLISDVVMPQMKGPELRDRMRAMRPDLDVLFISGYASNAFVNESDARSEPVLQKPFTMGALAESARRAMRRY